MKTFKEYLLLSEARGIFPNIYEVSERIYKIIYDKIIEDLNQNNNSVIIDFNKIYSSDVSSSIIEGQYVCNAGDEFVIANKKYDKLIYRIIIDFAQNFNLTNNVYKDKPIIFRGASTKIPDIKHKTGKYIVYEELDAIEINMKYILNKDAIVNITPATFDNIKTEIIDELDNLNSESIGIVSHELGHIFTMIKRNKKGLGFGEAVEYSTNMNFIKQIYNIKNIYKFYFNKYILDKVEIHNYPTEIYSSLVSNFFETRNDLINAIKNSERYKDLDEICKFSYDNFISGLIKERREIEKFLIISELSDILSKEFPHDGKLADFMLNGLVTNFSLFKNFLVTRNLSKLIPVFDKCKNAKNTLTKDLKKKSDIQVIESFLGEIYHILKQHLKEVFRDVLPNSEKFKIIARHMFTPTPAAAEDEINKMVSDEIFSKYKNDPQEYYKTEIEKMQKIAEKEKRRILRIVSFYDENTKRLTPL